MKYAARQTWPDKSANWDYLAEADEINDFALMYAQDKALAAGSEFVVIEKAGADSDIQFFKVSRTEPYALVPAEPRVESASNPAPQPAAETTKRTMAEQSIGDVWRAFVGNALFFIRAGGSAFLIFIVAIFLARWLLNAW